MIGIFDSGSGGLTVARAIRQEAPKANMLYFGDIANAPYGNKTDQELVSLTLKGFALLRSHGAKHLVSACNSISAKVVRPLTQEFNPLMNEVVEMVQPAAEMVRELNIESWVGLATTATTESKMYQEAYKKRGMSIQMISCPNLAEYIEFGAKDEQINKEIDDALSQIENRASQGLLLGCTHYPILQEKIAERAYIQGLKMHILDPAEAVAKEVIKRFGAEGQGKTLVLTSKYSPIFSQRCKEFLGVEPLSPQPMDNSVDNSWKVA